MQICKKLIYAYGIYLHKEYKRQSFVEFLQS
jgi:hypothetical protein